ncbi:hypothetical protein PDK06_23755 [Bacillus cereus group sp. TH217LC]|uniref:hypothetical protein n=1 Tax=Bacillus TaxID=1386 RepID=UPI00065B4CB6|nr:MULTISPECIES: hypothetical protein [Bacillus]KMP17970.1 hypothetical protein TU49_19275 [Bacillus cereus]MCD9103791.1 hypothetical protein [Bacillus sp. PLB03]MCU5563511.1 hypothetical protein [Bacillus paranthracis]MDA1597823.1 hypothetical protein [Bacillus cereus group sp. TH217LC]MDG0881828.1 hypothetical protein [Bacillus paranthracis]
MEVIIVCGGTLGEAFDMLRKAFINTAKQIEEFVELIKDACMYEEEPKYKEHINFPFIPVKVMKSQVIDRKPKYIRARTVC